jgi:iron complex outermembrane recepter protein
MQKVRAFLIGATILGTGMIPAAAFAQEAPAAEETAVEEDVGNEIIVTASKRAQTLQDTPIAVSVTTSESIERSQVRDLLDIQTLVPSLRVGQLQNSANTNFIIRGFGNGANNAGIEPSVGVFIDGVYRSRSAAQIGDLPNVQRVEVLRGPQSTLFGKNASAGIISIVTQEPKFDFGGSAELSYGNFNAIVAKADVTGPLSEKIAFAISGGINKRDGYVLDLGTGNKTNERNRWGVRGQLLFEATEDLKFRLIGDFDSIDEACCGVVNIVDGPTGNAVRALGGRIVSNAPFARTQWRNFDTKNDIENYGVSLQMNWETGPFDITTIGAYRAVRTDTLEDSDFTSADIIGFNGGTSAIDTYTLEARVATDFDGPVNFLLGGFYFHENIDISSSLRFGRDFRNYANLLAGGNYIGLEATLRALSGLPGLAGLPASQLFGAQGQGRFENYDYANRAFSIFGQADWEIVEGLTLSVGGNYTKDRKSVATNNTTTDVFSNIDLVRAGANAGFAPAARAQACGGTTVTAGVNCNPFLGLRGLQFLPPFLNFPNAVESGKTSDGDISYNIRLSWEASDNISVYATHATGYKGVSFNLSTDSRPFARDFIPGSAFAVPAPAASPIRTALGAALPNNLTTGTRFAEPEQASVYELGIKGSFDGFAFNLALFEQALKGFQGNVFIGTGFVLSNAEKQSVRGLEFDMSISPIRNLTFTGALTYLDSKFDSYVGGSQLVPGAWNVVPTNLTGQTPAGIPEYSLSFGGTYTAELGGGAELTFHADYHHESNVQVAQGVPNIKRSVDNLSSSMTLALENGLSLSVWGRNLTNDVYTTTIFPSVAQAGSLSGYRNQPRTYGVGAKFKF